MGISITYAAIYRKHDNIKAISDFSDVFQFAKIQFFIFLRVYLTELHTPDSSTLIVVSQEPGIPIVQICSMEDTFPFNLYNPRHATVIASGSNDLYIFCRTMSFP